MPAPSTTFLRDTLDKADVLEARQRVRVEWNMNRYSEVALADNFGYPDADHNQWTSLFPISSIVEPNRPTTGLATARVDVSQVFDSRSDIPDLDREYVADPANKYKHWSSPTPSQVVSVSGSYPIANAKPFVKYGRKVVNDNKYFNTKANKIVITFDISQSKPVLWDLFLRTGAENVTFNDSIDAGAKISNVAVDVKGQVTVYYQTDGTWAASPGDYLLADPCLLSSIYVKVNSMNKAGQYLNVIEISPRVERDISERVIDFSTSYELGEDDQVSPVGVISSNTGSISVSNARDNAVYPDPGYFETTNLYGPLDANVKFMLDYGIDTTQFSGAGFEWTRIATMYSEEWQTSEDTMSIELKDSSKFLQEIQPNAMLFQNLSIGECIWRILDSVGMNNWKYNVAADAANMQIAYFWTNPEETVWRNIQDLCRGTQSVAYIDEDGVFQIETRDSAFKIPVNPSDIMTFRSDSDGAKLPNIETFDFGSEFQVNSVTVNYRPTDLAKDAVTGAPISEIVWQPEDTVVLRCSQLFKAMTISDMTFFMNGNDAQLWPYEGMVNIQGELIKYSGKQYSYIDQTGAWKLITLKSAEEKNALDNDPTRADVGQNWRNYFPGLFYITERGVGATHAEAHTVDINRWTAVGGYYGQLGGAQTKWTGGLKFVAIDGYMRMETNKTFSPTGIYVAPRPVVPYTYADTIFGTRFRFPITPTGAAFNSAGLWFYGNASNNAMYMVEVTPTYSIEGGNLRATANEIRVLKRNGSGALTALNKGYAFGVVRGQWLDVDVRIEDYRISVSVNGRLVVVVQDNSARLTKTNKCGIYVRGWTAADFEYFYTVPGGLTIAGDPDEADFLSQLRGGYESRQMFKLIPLANGGVSKVLKEPYKDRFIEEFGTPIHEVREYNVKFEKSPVLYSSLYVSNEDQIVTPQYIGNPFGADFTIANSSRIHSVVNGEDTVTYGSENSVDQKMVITARTIQQQDEKKYQVKNQQAINARGEITLEISSDWIQSETAAKSIGDWIIGHWAEPADTFEVTVFGNPLIRVGDVGAFTYAPKGISNVKAVVLKKSNSWDDGLVTTLVCRKCPSTV